MTEQEIIYDELGVARVVDAAGRKTRIGDSHIRPEAMEATSRAPESFVRISDLQARPSDRIQDVTGTEAGHVARGASGSMCLAIAACIAGDDLGAVSRLPATPDVPGEVVMPRTHRNGYDHAIRAAGATIVDVGANDNHLGTGSKNTGLWEIADAISEDTAAVAYMEKADTRPPLPDVVEVAHDHDVPVLVDAAAERPPKSNLWKFTAQGAGLVVFSGEKAVRGPQTTGILAGRDNLVGSAARQHLDMHVAEAVWDLPADLIDLGRYEGVPRQGLGRHLRVGKEELARIIRALELFVEEDTEVRQQSWHARAERVAEALSEPPGYDTELRSGGKTNAASSVWVTVAPGIAGVDVETVVRGLRDENPRVFVGSDHIYESAFTVDPMCMTDEKAEYVTERVLSYHGRSVSGTSLANDSPCFAAGKARGKRPGQCRDVGCPVPSRTFAHNPRETVASCFDTRLSPV